MTDTAPALDTKSRDVTFWLDQVKRYDRYVQKWTTRAKKITKVYLDQHRDVNSSKREYAMLWSNTETLKPAVYSQPPTAVVSRRFKDADPVARTASEILERAINYTIDCSEVDARLEQMRDDYLLVARGTGWVRYEPDMRQVQPPPVMLQGPIGGEFYDDGQGNQIGLDDPRVQHDEEGLPYVVDDPYEEVAYERVCIDHVNWPDFGFTPARVWEEVRAVWRVAYMTREALVKRFGKEIGDKVGLDHKPDRIVDEGADDRSESEAKATVYEIWDKHGDKVVFVAKAYDEVLGDVPPFLKVKGFFPCPKPAWGTKTNDALISVPDYVFYQDQAEEINTLTARIAYLTDALKLVGFYKAGPDGDGSSAIEGAMRGGDENKLVPIPGWAAFKDAGGAKGMIEWVPVDMVIQVLAGCYEARKQLIEDVYQITGISDILRGSTDAAETATAQSIKAQWGSIRIKDRQKTMAKLARDCCRLIGEVIADKFSPETLMTMTGIKMVPEAQKKQAQAMVQQMQQRAAMQAAPPPTGGTALSPQMPPAAMGGPGAAPPAAPPMAPPKPPEIPPELQQILDTPTIEEVMGLLRDDASRDFRIDIETDSTVQPDEDADKQRAVELVTAVGGFIQQVVPIVQQVPQLAPLAAEMLLFSVRRFRGGRTMEEAVEKSMDQLVQQAANPQPPPPDPAMLKAQTDEKRLGLDTEVAKAKVVLEQGWQALDADKIEVDRQQQAQDRALNAHQADQDRGLQERQGQQSDRTTRAGLAARAAQQQRPQGNGASR